MKKVFKLEELDCANCARKMEEAIGKLFQFKYLFHTITPCCSIICSMPWNNRG